MAIVPPRDPYNMRTNTRTKGAYSSYTAPKATTGPETESQWSQVKVTAAINFTYSTDISRFHNGVVRNQIVYCRKTDKLKDDSDPLYFLLYRRPKGYWVGHLLTAKDGEGKLTTLRDPITNKPLKIPRNSLSSELESFYIAIMGDLKTYTNINHKK